MNDHDEHVKPQQLPFLMRLHGETMAPIELLLELVESLNSTPIPDPDLCRETGCGPLESLLMVQEDQLWSEIEHLARTDRRFRRALASVWAYRSPRYEQRSALLAELGEVRELTIRFTVRPKDFSNDPPLSWHAAETPDGVRPGRLADVLRQIADWLDDSPMPT